MGLLTSTSVWRAPRAVARLAVTAVTVCSLAACAPSAAASRASASPSTSTSTKTAPATATPATTQPLLVVGLGDSVMSGTACDCSPFIATYATALGKREHVPAHATNLGVAGLTVPGLLTQVETAAGRKTLAAASVVVVTIGANDLVPLVGQWQEGLCGDTCVGKATAALADPLQGLFAQIVSEAQQGARILVTTYWNVFEDGDVADHDYGPGFATWSDDVTGRANDQICAAAKQVSATCVDLYTPFNGSGGKNPTSLLADDGDHPNAAGHALIATTLLAATPASGR